MNTIKQEVDPVGPSTPAAERRRRIGMGAWAISGDYGGIDETGALQTIAAALRAGVVFFDTADSYGYGLGEERLGRGLQDLGDTVRVSTKVGNWGRRLGHPLPFTHWSHVVVCCEASLRRLRRERIDCYLIHQPNPEHPEVYDEAFERLLAQGKIAAVGISTNNLAALKKLKRVDMCQCDYSLLNRQAEEALLPYCQEHGIEVVARGVLHRGLLSGKFSTDTEFADFPRQKMFADRERYLQRLQVVDRLRPLVRPGRSLTDIAIAFALRHPAVARVIPGMKTVEQVTANLAAADTQFDDVTWAQIQDLT